MINQEVKARIKKYFDEACKELMIDCSAYILQIVTDKKKFASTENSAEWDGNILYINQEWVELCLQNKAEFDLIYILSHETRHIYQHHVIADFKQRGKSSELPAVINQWEYEFSHYIRNEGDEDKYEKNVSQQVEIDANAFANCMLLKNGLGARIKPGQEEIMEKAIKAMAKKLWKAQIL